MQYSHSRVETFNSCPYKYKLRYVDKLKTIPDYEPNNALICGNTIHTGAEKDLKAALEFYKSNYYVLTDNHINEIIKFEYLIPKIKELLLDINIYAQEYLISTHRFRGIVDLIVKNFLDGTVDVFDFKYSNAIEHYMESPQLHIYKYFLEQKGFKVRKLGFIFIPKISIRQKKTEDLYKFRKRLIEELKKSEINLLEVPYNPNKVIEFMDSIIDTTEVKEYKKNPTRLCDWCEYKDYCMKGIDYMILPSTERREISEVSKKVMWWYGAPFSGKTTLANKFPNPLMLNTDGNIKFVDAPFLPIKDKVVVEGRMTKRTLAWEIFKEVIEELEKKQNDFKTIIVDLLEDTYEHCRLYMYDKLGIEHESDNSFKAWDMVRTEFLSTLKRLMNLDYENIILISHEDMSKDVTKKSGDKVTRIAPNIQEKAANKIAGMVDIVARVIAEGDERFMDFKPSEVIFGGGRLTVESNRIPLEYKALMKVYDEANAGKKEPKKEKTTPVEDKKEEKSTIRRSKKEDAPVEEEVKETTLEEVNEPKEEPTEEPKEETKEEKPKRRRRRKADEE
ncbi:AAA family ATPase [Clostridium botulinum]|uniref:Phage NTP-binding protein n=1 Tax=Clostridium botulinum CFSAN001627 TaxID=1232189 RepID=M1ZVW8_CLOBO|nr:AAA family ATPase [Clostridium botulinum]EKN40885.1 phage NTP-binding protein [Clostridium botulinum CFSAN001627]APC84717.1 AAA domain protein [Clostridium botulinum]AXG95374.1 NTP-binding protein [Clostridium botulinum]EDT82704.1 phage NTP-binding protein [Clostridium botulinum NCTC 2916]MBY6770512.1 AAA family ATPase [Clostridium botulinum]